MSGPVQLIPPGFLGFMQLKNSGRLPSELVDQINPTFSMLDWYMQANAETVSASTSGITTGGTGDVQFPTLVAPDDQYWWVIAAELHMAASAGVGDRSSFGFVIVDTQNQRFAPDWQQPWDGSIAATAATPVAPIAFASRFFVPSGCGVRMFLSSLLTAANQTATLSMRIVRLPN